MQLHSVCYADFYLQSMLPCLFADEDEPNAPCRLCPAGFWSPGNSTEPCVRCGFSFTSLPGSTEEAACYAINACPIGTEVHKLLAQAESLADCVCKPGFGAVPGSDICHICPAGSYAYGGAKEGRLDKESNMSVAAYLHTIPIQRLATENKEHCDQHLLQKPPDNLSENLS